MEMPENTSGSVLEQIRVLRTVDGVDFNEVADLLQSVSIGDFSAEVRERAFRNSDIVVFCYLSNKLIACGRALSDGAYEAALYDVAVSEQLQGQGIGSFVVQAIFAELEGQNVIFYSAVGKQPFYEKLGCLSMKTGMARFARPERMRNRGYID
jgi:ribosomal protein S18 acetylase RimI-like enzyme